MELDEVLAQLSALATQLSELPSDAFDDRLRLRMRQEELRAISRKLMQQSSDPESAEEIRRRLEHLESERDRHLSTRLGHSAAAQTGMGGGIDPKFVHDMHAQMDKAFNLDEVNKEITRLRRELDRLEANET